MLFILGRYNEQIYLTPTQKNSVARQVQKQAEITKEENAISVFPNPASNELYFLFNLENENDRLSVEIMDINGRIVLQKNMENNREPQKLDLSGMADGVYFYRVTAGNKTFKPGKVVIMK